jgi:hypothetical protein
MLEAWTKGSKVPFRPSNLRPIDYSVWNTDKSDPHVLNKNCGTTDSRGSLYALKFNSVQICQFANSPPRFVPHSGPAVIHPRGAIIARIVRQLQVLINN